MCFMNFDLFTIKGNLYKKLIQQLCDEYKTIFFYQPDKETAHTHIYNTTVGNIYIETDDKRIEEEFSIYEPWRSYYHRKNK